VSHCHFKSSHWTGSHICYYFFFVVLQPNAGQDLHINVSRSHSLDAPHSVRLLWKSYQFVAETSTWQHTTLDRDKHSRPPTRFEPKISADKGPLTYALGGPATGIGLRILFILDYNISSNSCTLYHTSTWEKCSYKVVEQLCLDYVFYKILRIHRVIHVFLDNIENYSLLGCDTI
jgi:hypothetical protein